MLSKLKTTILIILFCLINVHHAVGYDLPNEFSGEVIKVIDGDTIHLESKNISKIKIRLADIDTPELNQPYGKKSKKILETLILGEEVMIKKVGVDRYKRVIGIVMKDNLDVNHFLVINGHAWCYDYYNKRHIIKIAESIAKRKKIGIWKNQNAIPPWEWRKK